MDAERINRLMAERVMGWHLEKATDSDAGHWRDGADKFTGYRADARFASTMPWWNPATDVNQALEALEKVAGEKQWSITATGDDEFGPFECCISVPDEHEYLGMRNEALTYGETVAKSVCLCCLKSAGIPESELP